MCDTILKSYDINIMNILTNEDEKACESALHTFVGIIAIQVKYYKYTNLYENYIY